MAGVINPSLGFHTIPRDIKDDDIAAMLVSQINKRCNQNYLLRVHEDGRLDVR